MAGCLWHSWDPWLCSGQVPEARSGWPPASRACGTWSNAAWPNISGRGAGRIFEIQTNRETRQSIFFIQHKTDFDPSNMKNAPLEDTARASNCSCPVTVRASMRSQLFLHASMQFTVYFPCTKPSRPSRLFSADRRVSPRAPGALRHAPGQAGHHLQESEPRS